MLVTYPTININIVASTEMKIINYPLFNNVKYNVLRILVRVSVKHLK